MILQPLGQVMQPGMAAACVAHSPSQCASKLDSVMSIQRGKRAGNTPRELEVDQSKAPGCQRCGSNSSIRPAGCVGNRVSTSLM